MKKRLRIVIPLLVIVLAAVGWKLVIKGNTDDQRIRLSGNIDVTQADLGFKIPGRLGQRLVDEGDPVTRDQRLAFLDNTDQRLQVQKAVADADYAASFLAELLAGSRPAEIKEAQADLQRAQAEARTAGSELALAQADFDRYQAVFKDGGISQQAFDTYRTRLVTAKNAAAAAAARQQAASQRLSLRQEGSRREQIDQARAKDAAARAALAIARQQLTETDLLAPFDGVVLSTSAEPGTYLNPGTPVLTVGDIRNVWLRAFVDETDLGRIRLGQSAEVGVDAYPRRRWKGQVSFISSAAEFTPRLVQTFKERTNLVYRIKIRLDNPDGALKPGMPADALIEAAP